MIVYSNPDRIFLRLKRFLKFFRSSTSEKELLYFYAHSLSWWNRFKTNDVQLEIKPWRSLTAKDARRFIPDNKLGHFMLAMIFAWEKYFPRWAVSWGAYPMIVLKKI